MWLLFSSLCMIALTASEIVGKKAVASDDLAPLKLRISAMAVSIVIGLSMYAFGLGESGLAPWISAWKHPLILVAACFTIVSDFLYLLSLRWIGMSVMEAISSLEGIVIFWGLISIHLVSGELSAVRDMLVPARLVLIGVILVFTFLLPTVAEAENGKAIPATGQRKEKRTVLIGILTALLAVITSSCDSLITDVLLGTGSVGTADYIMTGYFSSVIPLPVFCVVLFRKSRHITSSRRIFNRCSVLYTVLFVTYFFLGLLANSIDAVRSEVMYLTYPVIAIFGAKIFLKEKYTRKQNLCIWIITVAAIAFCVIDYIV